MPSTLDDIDHPLLDNITAKLMATLQREDKPVNKSYWADKAGVSRDSLYRRIQRLETAGLVEEVSIGSRGTFYRLTDDPKTDAFFTIMDEVEQLDGED